MSIVQDIADLYDPQPSPWLGDPVGWTEGRLSEDLWSKERAILESVRDHRRTAVHSCFDVGKSFTAARTVAWWLDNSPAYEAFAVTTAPTFPQVKAILWREIRRAHRLGKLKGRTNLTEWILGDEMIAMGRKPAEYDATAFQGIHARRVLVVIDEAAGVPKAIFDAVEGLVANEESRVLAIGNPDDSTSEFAEVCKPGSGWNVIHISAFDSPNFTEEPVADKLRPLLVSKTWVDERREKWGQDSPLYISKVLGEFPEDSDDGVVRASKVAKCRIPRDPDWVDGDLTPVELGVDVGAGGDFTSIRERRGRKAGRVWRDHSADSEKVVMKVVHAIRETGATRVKVDTIGIGWGVVGHLRSLRGKKPEDGGHKAQIVPINVAESPHDGERFAKLRDEIWWEIGRELSDDEWWDLSSIDDDTTAQLLAPKYGIDAAGRIKVEKKEETKKRLAGSSPDDADALLLAFYGRGSGAGSGTSSLGHIRQPG